MHQYCKLWIQKSDGKALSRLDTTKGLACSWYFKGMFDSSVFVQVMNNIKSGQSASTMTQARLNGMCAPKNISTKEFKVVTKQAPSQAQKLDLEFAFRLVKFIKSNAILIVKNGQTIGIGAGQMSRVDAVEIALKKAGANANGAVLASDAFFPFKDSVELCVKHGITSIIQPGGSKRDQESIDTCDNSKISMVFTGTRHFRH